MILTYQTSKYHATVADFAVEEWWKLFRARYPGGIRQTMTDYLAGGAPGNPFAERVQDFDNVRNQDAEMVDDSPDLSGLLDPIGGILTSDCGTSPVGACINLKSFSPTSFLAPFSLALSSATQAETTVQTAILTQQIALTIQKGSFDKASLAFDTLSKQASAIQAQRDSLVGHLQRLMTQKEDLITKQLDKLHLPQGCSTLWNGQDFKQVIDARQSGAVAVLAEGAGLA